MSTASRPLPGDGGRSPRGAARLLGAVGARTLVLGSGAHARKIVEALEAESNASGSHVGVIADPAEGFARLVDATRLERIVVALDDQRDPLPVESLLEARARGTLVEDWTEAYERLTGKLALEAVTPSSLVFSRGFRMSRWHAFGARALGLTLSTLGLIVLAPLLAMVALLVKLDSRGPVFFVQERVGLRGRPFPLIKFRTMHPRAQRTSEWERDNCDRITRVGRWLRRFRLDELPQLLNVVRGDMNFVGPRPHPITNLELFILTLRNMNDVTGSAIPYYALRCAVRPGITGWAQVRHGYANGLEEEVEKIRYDLYYLKYMSFALDLRILLETFQAVVWPRRGADRDGALAPQGTA